MSLLSDAPWNDPVKLSHFHHSDGLLEILRINAAMSLFGAAKGESTHSQATADPLQSDLLIAAAVVPMSWNYSPGAPAVTVTPGHLVVGSEALANHAPETTAQMRQGLLEVIRQPHMASAAADLSERWAEMVKISADVYTSLEQSRKGRPTRNLPADWLKQDAAEDDDIGASLVKAAQTIASWDGRLNVAPLVAAFCVASALNPRGLSTWKGVDFERGNDEANEVRRSRFASDFGANLSRALMTPVACTPGALFHAYEMKDKSMEWACLSVGIMPLSTSLSEAAAYLKPYVEKPEAAPLYGKQSIWEACIPYVAKNMPAAAWRSVENPDGPLSFELPFSIAQVIHQFTYGTPRPDPISVAAAQKEFFEAVRLHHVGITNRHTDASVKSRPSRRH
jgi:hypothetical protein